MSTPEPVAASEGLKLAEELRTACETVRRKPYPIADLIPLMQRAADALTPAVQQAVEPVAWLWADHGHVQSFTSKPPPKMLADIRCHPTPPPAPPAPTAGLQQKLLLAIADERIDNPDNDEDRAYNTGLLHAADAVRAALASTTPNGQTP